MKAKRRKSKTITHAGIIIREVRPDYYLVDFQRDLRRERKCFDTLAAAKIHCDRLAQKVSNEGSSFLTLSATQREDALKALEVLSGKASLHAAAKFWKQHNVAGEGMTVADLGTKWFAALRRSGCRKTTMRDREHKVGRLVKAYGDRPAVSIMADDLVGLMDALHLSGTTADGYRRCWHALFSYALTGKVGKKRKVKKAEKSESWTPIVSHNPAALLEAFETDEKLPTPLSVKAVRAIMSAAEEYAPAIVATLAVQFFAGLRPGEAMGLTWENIDLEEKMIRVMPEVSKMRRSRIVDINPTLAAWLRRYRKRSGPVGIVTQNQFDFAMRRKHCGDKVGLLAAAGVKWIQDGPRKSFASYHFATHQDQAKLASILGHTGDAKVLYEHYRGLVTKKAAAVYWQIRPATKNAGNLIQFEKAVS